MSQYVLRRIASNICRPQGFANYQYPVLGASSLKTFGRCLTDDVKDVNKPQFDVSLLEVLVCPLSKKPLRYEEQTSELINEELGIAYPIIDGIPNMIPQDARLIQKTETPEGPSSS